MRVILLALLFTSFVYGLRAQSIGIGTTSPNPSAMLDVSASNKGFLPPRMSKIERNAIVAPADGLVVFQIGVDSSGLYYFNNGGWAWLQPATKPQGKTFIFLKDGITNAQAEQQLAKEVGTNTQYISIKNTTALTSVNLSGLEEIIELKVENNSALTSIVANTLTSTQDGILISQNPQLGSVNLQSVTSFGYLTLTNNNLLSTVNLSSLTNFSSNSGNIISTNPALTTMSFPALSNIGSLTINSNGVSSINFPSLTSSGGLTLTGNNSLNSLSFPLLTAGGSLNINGNAVLSSINLPLLTTAASITMSNLPLLTTINASALTTIGDFGLTVSNCNSLSNLTFGSLSSANSNLDITSNSALISISLAGLINAKEIRVQTNSLLTGLSLPLLTTATRIIVNATKITTLVYPMLQTATTITIGSCIDLNSISFPALTTATGFSSVSNTSLSSISIPALTSYGNNFVVNNCQLNTTMVNNLLVKLFSITPGSGKTIFLNGNTPPAPPTGAGATAKATLIAQGNFVTTD